MYTSMGIALCIGDLIGFYSIAVSCYSNIREHRRRQLIFDDLSPEADKWIVLWRRFNCIWSHPVLPVRSFLDDRKYRKDRGLLILEFEKSDNRVRTVLKVVQMLSAKANTFDAEDVLISPLIACNDFQPLRIEGQARCPNCKTLPDFLNSLFCGLFMISLETFKEDKVRNTTLQRSMHSKLGLARNAN